MVPQLSVLFQIIEKAGTIPWDNIKLPADRTLLAAKKMINNEREKVTAMNNGEAPASATKVINTETRRLSMLFVLTCRVYRSVLLVVRRSMARARRRSLSKLAKPPRRERLLLKVQAQRRVARRR